MTNLLALLKRRINNSVAVLRLRYNLSAISEGFRGQQQADIATFSCGWSRNFQKGSSVCVLATMSSTSAGGQEPFSASARTATDTA